MTKVTSAGDRDYGQARLQARHGMRPRTSDWSRLEASRDLQHFLSAAMTSPLMAWVQGLTPEMTSHDLERALREAWRAYVQRVATWLPAAWQPAVVWAGTLTELPLVARLADPAPCPAWMFADPLFGSVAPGVPAERAAALALTSLAPLATTVGISGDVRGTWAAQWRRLLPAMNQDTTDDLRRLERIVGGRIELRPGDERTGRSATVNSIAGVERLFRRSAGTAVSALAHLALTAFDLERLRGGLAERAVFASARQAA
jgi:hypothetical protein